MHYSIFFFAIIELYLMSWYVYQCEIYCISHLGKRFYTEWKGFAHEARCAHRHIARQNDLLTGWRIRMGLSNANLRRPCCFSHSNDVLYAVRFKSRHQVRAVSSGSSPWSPTSPTPRFCNSYYGEAWLLIFMRCAFAIGRSVLTT